MPKDVDDVFSDFQDSVNMTASELEAWKESDNFETYTERKSGGQEPTEPINDAIRLLETPKSEWECSDSDGFNECKEAEELVNFNSRMSQAEQGEPMPNTDPPLSKRDASLLSWGRDVDEDSSDFVGDRQR